MTDKEVIQSLIRKSVILGDLDKAGIIKVGEQGESVWSADGSHVAYDDAIEAHANLKNWGGPRPGAGRPSTGRTKKTISLSPEAWSKLKENADFCGSTMSEQLEKLIQAHIR